MDELNPQPELTSPDQPPAPEPELKQIIEALLFAADGPLTLTRLAEITAQDETAIQQAIDDLNRTYAQTARSFRVSRVAQGYQLYTLPEYADWIRKLYAHTRIQRLSAAALEVLAIIAYQQPVTRPEIEQLRGVDCSAPLLTLLERGLIVTAGRAHRPGNPFLYRTTREFLRYFGLESLDDLPRLEELGQFLASREPETT
jgi:segregation and condensation protein B